MKMNADTHSGKYPIVGRPDIDLEKYLVEVHGRSIIDYDQLKRDNPSLYSEVLEAEYAANAPVTTWEPQELIDDRRFSTRLLGIPIRTTVTALIISIVATFLFSMASLYLMRVCHTAGLETGSCKGPLPDMLLRELVADFTLLTRLATEVLGVLLIVQLGHRIFGRLTVKK